MNKSVFAALTTVMVLLAAVSVEAEEFTVNVSIDDSLFVTYEFTNLDPTVYEQAEIGFPAERIPQTIADYFEARNQTVRWELGSLPLVFDPVNHAICNSFFLSGSPIMDFSLNRTTLRRVYEVKTDWRKFKVNLTDNYSIDFAQRLAKPVAEWQKPNVTTFDFESKETDAPDIKFSVALPPSALEVRAVGDTVFYEVQPYLEDILLGTPFLILIALVVAFIIILLYRRIR